MRVHELDRAECEAVLRRTEMGRLACARDNQPYIVPIHFSFDLGAYCLYGFSTVGQKIEWMRENPKVCLEVAEVTDKDHWMSVVVFGRYEEVHDSLDGEGARAYAWELFRRRPEWWFPAAATVAGREPAAVVIYRIHIDQLTGRRASRDSTQRSTS
jgi:nitroimidazol reductase NimA-like FMN-containing flavoprotein (pyridoxamine 5'-phosphate oxidase superfamily)